MNNNDMNKKELLTAINNYLDRNKSTESQRYVHGDEVCDKIDVKIEVVRDIVVMLIEEYYKE